MSAEEFNAIVADMAASFNVLMDSVEQNAMSFTSAEHGLTLVIGRGEWSEKIGNAAAELGIVNRVGIEIARPVPYHGDPGDETSEQ